MAVTQGLGSIIGHLAGGYLLASVGVPVCCWAVPEPKKEGVLLFNSMTGLNLFTSVANSGREIPAVKWLYGNADDTLFVNRFLTTVGAIRCLKAIKCKKIAIAGGVAE